MNPKSNKRQRRTYKQLFIDELEKLSNGESKLHSNKLVLEKLGWDRERFDRIKEQLVDEEKIIKGRGKGGTVGLARTAGARSLRAFISYSHIDEKLKDELLKHLQPLVRLDLIEQWNDRKIKPGDAWEEEISKNLEASDVILLLISIDFINSDYCYGIELEKALEMHGEGKALVIPIILRSCLWHHAPFAKLQALPKDGKAVTTWENQDDALASVAEGIRISSKAFLDSRIEE